METAVQELSSRQLAKIAELTKQIEKKAGVLEQVYTANIGKLKRFKVKEEDLVVPDKFKSPGKKRFGSPTDPRLSQVYGRAYRSPRLNESQTMRGILTPGDQTLRPIKSERDFNTSQSAMKKDKSRFHTKGKLSVNFVQSPYQGKILYLSG